MAPLFLPLEAFRIAVLVQILVVHARPGHGYSSLSRFCSRDQCISQSQNFELHDICCSDNTTEKKIRVVGDKSTNIQVSVLSTSCPSATGVLMSLARHSIDLVKYLFRSVAVLLKRMLNCGMAVCKMFVS